MSQPSWVPPPSMRIQRSSGGTSQGGRRRSRSVSETSRHHETTGRPRGKSASNAELAQLHTPLLAVPDTANEPTQSKALVPASRSRIDLTRYAPWSKAPEPEAYRMTPQGASSGTGNASQLQPTPRSILYPNATPSAAAMQPTKSEKTTASAPAAQTLPKQHLKIYIPEAIRASPTQPDIDELSEPPTRRGSLATVLNAASSMNPMPRLSSMWSNARSDDAPSQRSTPRPSISDDGRTSNEEGNRHWSTYLGPFARRKGTEGGEEHEEHPPMHSDQMVDYLDVLDPAVGVFNTLQNFGNSTMLPNIPWIYDRRPTLHIDRVVDADNAPEPSPLSPSPLESQMPPQDKTPHTTEHPVEAEAEQLGREQIAHEQHPEHADRMLGPSTTSTSAPASTPAPALGAASTSSKALGSLRPSEDDLHSLSHKVTIGDESLQTLPDMEDDPHTARWWDMDEEERKELDNHVRYLLTNKSKAKRVLKGFWNFVRTPMGFILTTYGLLITAWGMFIVLLAIPWVRVGDEHRQRYWIEICDQVLCALFAAVGLGFAPFRAVDTYRMAYIAHYHFLTYKRRELLHLPKLKNENELPRYTRGRIERLLRSKDGTGTVSDAAEPDITVAQPEETDEGPKELDDPSRYLEAIGVKHATGGHAEEVYGFENLFGPVPGQPGAKRYHPDELQKQRLTRAPSIDSMVDKDTQEVSVLSPTEQATLQHQQRLFHASHTFYRYRETATHWPFPLRIMMAIVILLDCHSVLQGTLGGITWGIKYEHRPTALTATIISCSLTCNAMAGILIWQGGKRTRKTEVVQRRLKLALEERAIERMDRKRRKAAAEAKAVQNRLLFAHRSSV